MYDLLGKITGRPAYDLLGGKRRDSFVSTISLAAQEPEEMAEWAKMRYDQGFRGLEVHLGDAPGSGVAKDVRRMAAVREAVGPDVIIVGDVHRNWTVKEAIAGAEALAPFGLVIESPCRGIHALAQVKAGSKIPIGADEDCHTVQNAVDIVRQNAV
ncbi:MAG: mandelate racemase/muconate lactonizing enzyme family protein, partial [Actinobacteria bacterium]|nr:mandelate racemase/muconate lactonizing enzyme family protein [Actinomycetota bacterium]